MLPQCLDGTCPKEQDPGGKNTPARATWIPSGERQASKGLLRSETGWGDFRDSEVEIFIDFQSTNIGIFLAINIVPSKNQFRKTTINTRT